MTHNTMTHAAEQIVFSHFSLAVEISAHLEPKDIFLLVQTHQAIRHIIEQDAFWKHWGEHQDPRQYENHLIHAAKTGNLTQMTRLIISGVDPTIDNNIATRRACFYGHAVIVRHLLKHYNAEELLPIDGTTVAFNGPGTVPAFIEACNNGCTEVVRLLLSVQCSDGTPLIDPAADNNRAIRVACQNNYDNTGVMRLLLEDGRVDPADVDNAALKCACGCGHIEEVRLLLSLKNPDGTQVVDPTAGENQALHNACRTGAIEAVRLLLSLRSPDGNLLVNPNVYNHSNTYFNHYTAIHGACEGGDENIVRLLLADERVDPTVANNRAIRWACGDGHAEIVRLLLADGRADPDAGLREARRKNNTDLIELIEEHIAKAEATAEAT